MPRQVSLYQWLAVTLGEPVEELYSYILTAWVMLLAFTVGELNSIPTKLKMV